MDQKDFRENLELKPVTQEHIDHSMNCFPMCSK